MGRPLRALVPALLLLACTPAPGAGVGEGPATGPAVTAASADRHPVYAERRDGGLVLSEAADSGAPRRLTSLPENTKALALSPDGKSVAIVRGGPPDRIVVKDLRDSGSDRTVLEAGPDDQVQGDLGWSPDGRGLAVVTAPRENAPGAPSTTTRLLWVPVDRGAPRELLSSTIDIFFITRWSADGRALYFGRARYRTGDPGSLWSIAADGRNAQDMRLPRAFADVAPDGDAVVYAPLRPGTGVAPEVWEATPGQGGRPLARVPGLQDLRLFPDGNDVLALSQPDGKRSTLGLARIRRTGGLVTQLSARYEAATDLRASFAPRGAIAPSGEGALLVVYGPDSGEQILWADLRAGQIRLLSTATSMLLAGWR